MVTIIKVSHTVLGDCILGGFDLVREIRKGFVGGMMPEMRSRRWLGLN